MVAAAMTAMAAVTAVTAAVTANVVTERRQRLVVVMADPLSDCADGTVV